MLPVVVALTGSWCELMAVSKRQASWLAAVAVLWAGVFAPAWSQTSSPITSLPNSPTVIATPSDLAVGKLAQSPNGRTIATVKDVVADPANRTPAYVLLATGSGTTALPFWAVSHLLRDAHLVIDPGALAAAPRVSDQQVRSGSDNAWKEEADRYWQAYR